MENLKSPLSLNSFDKLLPPTMFIDNSGGNDINAKYISENVCL